MTEISSSRTRGTDGLRVEGNAAGEVSESSVLHGLDVGSDGLGETGEKRRGSVREGREGREEGRRLSEAVSGDPSARRGIETG